MSAIALNLLHRKLFLQPNEFSEIDQSEMDRLKLIVYTASITELINSHSNNDLNTTPDSGGTLTTSSSSGGSVQSDYTKNVISNRFFKNQFESVTFASISPFLDDCKNHLQTAANFHAMFINFIR
jgi:hypothetical protein